MKRLYTFSLALVVAAIVIGGAVAAGVGIPTKHVHHFCFVVDPRGGATMHDLDTSPNVSPPKGWRRVCVDPLRGKTGKNGTNGTNGKDGINGTNGKDGTNGQPGPPGLGQHLIYECVTKDAGEIEFGGPVDGTPNCTTGQDGGIVSTFEAVVN